MSNSDPARLRVSDEERHQVAEILREAAGAGRLDLDELDQRLDAAYAAKTYADLVPLTHDLPVPSLGRPPAQRAGALPAPGGDTHERHVAFMSGFDRKGVDEAFFPGGKVKSNFLINLGYGLREKLHPRQPRFSFDEFCRIA